jgi:hypothetical protein
MPNNFREYWHQGRRHRNNGPALMARQLCFPRESKAAAGSGFGMETCSVHQIG